MTADHAIELARHALLLALLLAAPVLAVSLVTSLISSILQTVTQLHDQSLSFVPKLLAVVIVALITLPWGINLLVEYTSELFQNIPASVTQRPDAIRQQLSLSHRNPVHCTLLPIEGTEGANCV
jgi:flagellar biosynthetic protein FliQ